MRSSSISKAGRAERVMRSAQRGSLRCLPRRFAFMFLSQRVNENDMENLLKGSQRRLNHCKRVRFSLSFLSILSKNKKTHRGRSICVRGRFRPVRALLGGNNSPAAFSFPANPVERTTNRKLARSFYFCCNEVEISVSAQR